MNRCLLAFVPALVALTACSAPYSTTSDDATETETEAALALPGKPTRATTAAAAADHVTLARRAKGGAFETLGVRGAVGAKLDVVNLSAVFNERPAYPLDLVTKHGLDAVAAAIASGAVESVDANDLAAPMNETTHHIAIGLNYPEHQAEAGSEGGAPFLFPKVVEPTKSRATVERKAGDLLDYEVELCVAFGSDIDSAADVTKTVQGFMVCNDLSNRVPQVMDADPLHPELAGGFTDAKSRPGFLPLGPVVVVPRDAKAFAAARSLRLSVNGEERQSDKGSSMVWDVERQVKEALAIGADPRFEHDGRPIALLPSGAIAKGQILVTGTPGGVVFRAPTTADKAKKAAEYIKAGGPFGTGTDPMTFIKESFVEEMAASGKFLGPGDEVECGVDLLGSIHVTIAGAKL